MLLSRVMNGNQAACEGAEMGPGGQSHGCSLSLEP